MFITICIGIFTLIAAAALLGAHSVRHHDGDGLRDTAERRSMMLTYISNQDYSLFGGTNNE